MALETFPYDTAEHLRTPEHIAAYIDAVLEDGDPALMADAIGVVARARGMAQITQETGHTHGQLYRMILETKNLQRDTLTGVLKAIGLRLSVKPIGTAA